MDQFPQLDQKGSTVVVVGMVVIVVGMVVALVVVVVVVDSVVVPVVIGSVGVGVVIGGLIPRLLTEYFLRMALSFPDTMQPFSVTNESGTF